VTYTFAATTGNTRTLLADLVLGNSFSSSRYGEQTKLYLNDAVTDICRRLQIIRDDETCAYDANGLVTQPDPPFFLVEDVWLTDGSGAVTFTARRSDSGTRLPGLTIEVGPVTGAGTVVIQGLRRPAIMDGDSDTTGLGADLDNAVVAFAKARLFELEDDFEAARAWDDRYERYLHVASQVTHNAAPVVTPGTWYDYDSGWGR
jgi:hypothetical protein